MYTDYAIIVDGAVVEYPVNPHTKHQLDPLWLGGEIDGKQYVLCHMGMYSYDPETQYLVEGTPTFDSSSGNWYRSFSVVDYVGDELLAQTDKLIRLANNTIKHLCDDADAQIQNKNTKQEQKTAWEDYKTAVQNVVLQVTFPFKIQWPEPQVQPE